MFAIWMFAIYGRMDADAERAVAEVVIVDHDMETAAASSTIQRMDRSDRVVRGFELVIGPHWSPPLAA